MARFFVKKRSQSRSHLGRGYNETEVREGGAERSWQADRPRTGLRDSVRCRENITRRGSEQLRKFVVFELGSERYGIAIERVQSIEYMQTITRAPLTPEYVRGVMNLRGVIMVVLDMRVLFNMPSREATHDSRILIVSDGGTEVGWIVDAANDVTEVEESEILPPNDETGESILGTIPDQEHVIKLLDLSDVLRRIAG